MTCRVGSPQSRTIYRYRVITFYDNEGHAILVMATVMDVGVEEIANIYKAR